jgi:chaperonin GroES
MINPIYDRVVVRPLKPETVTGGGIVLTAGAEERPNEGLVLAVGCGRRTKEGVTIPLEVKVGDTVMYYLAAGQPVKIDGEEVLVLREDEIYAVVISD